MAGLLLFVNPAGGERIPLELDPCASVADLLEALSAHLPGKLTLLFQDKPLSEPSALLADLGVCPESNLFIRGDSLQWISGSVYLSQARGRGKLTFQSFECEGGVPDIPDCFDFEDVDKRARLGHNPDGSLTFIGNRGDLWGQTSVRLPEEGEGLSPVFTVKSYKNMMWLIVSAKQGDDDNAFGYSDCDADTKDFLAFLNILNDGLYWRGAGKAEDQCPLDTNFHLDGVSLRFRVTADSDIILQHRAPGCKEIKELDWKPRARVAFQQVVGRMPPKQRGSISFGVASRNADNGEWCITPDWPQI